RHSTCRFCNSASSNTHGSEARDMTRIESHRIVGVPFVESQNQGGELEPEAVVLHYTATQTAESAIRTLTNRNASVSAHLVIDRDGTVTQLVPFDRVAWHAGESS